MTANELLRLTVENFLDYIDYCKDKAEKTGERELKDSKLDDWYLKLNKAVDDTYREQEGLPPRPITGRPKGSKDKFERRKRKGPV